jgi:hypothetical protein
MWKMTKSDYREFLRQVIRHVAEQLQVQEADWKSPRELLEDIRDKNEEVHNLLGRFLKAYTACFKDWTPKNITARNNARKALLQKLQPR